MAPREWTEISGQGSELAQGHFCHILLSEPWFKRRQCGVYLFNRSWKNKGRVRGCGYSSICHRTREGKEQEEAEQGWSRGLEEQQDCHHRQYGNRTAITGSVVRWAGKMWKPQSWGQMWPGRLTFLGPSLETSSPNTASLLFHPFMFEMATSIGASRLWSSRNPRKEAQAEDLEHFKSGFKFGSFLLFMHFAL